MLESILWCIEGILEIYFILAVVNVALYWCMHFNIIGQGGAAFKKFLVDIAGTYFDISVFRNCKQTVYAFLPYCWLDRKIYY